MAKTALVTVLQVYNIKCSDGPSSRATLSSFPVTRGPPFIFSSIYNSLLKTTAPKIKALLTFRNTAAILVTGVSVEN